MGNWARKEILAIALSSATGGGLHRPDVAPFLFAATVFHRDSDFRLRNSLFVLIPLTNRRLFKFPTFKFIRVAMAFCFSLIFWMYALIPGQNVENVSNAGAEG